MNLIHQLGLLNKLALLPVLLPVLIGSVVLHELAHALVARRLGDPTAERAGRITLHPLRHLDPAGAITFVVTFLFFAIPFGWARPVPISPENFRSAKRGMALVAIAGPIANLLVALVFAAIWTHVFSSAGQGYLAEVVYLAFTVNVVLSVFNMFPIPPLDGSRIIGAFMPDNMYRDWVKLDQYAILFLLFVVLIAQGPFFQLLGAGVQWSERLLSSIVGG